MHRLCKDIDIKDVETVLPWVHDCVRRHWKRHDFRDLLIANGMTRTKYYELLRMQEAKDLGVPEGCREQFNERLDKLMELYRESVRKIAETACGYIASRDPKVRRVYIKEREDKSTGKIRLIGSESAMQQVLDYIAKYGAMPIFERRIVPQQASSIEGRGQAYGVDMMETWIRRDDVAARYAKRHGKHYTRTCKFFVKTDIEKCFNSARLESFMKLFRRDCGNDDLIWLWEYLLQSHRVDGYEGFMIGALPSQWAVQYMISFEYRFVKSLHTERRGKKIRMVRHMSIFMDDMAMFSSSRKNLKRAVEKLETFMKEVLGFRIKKNWHIKELAREGIDMMGYVIHQNGKITIRARNFIRARRMALRWAAGVKFTERQAKRTTSYKGFFDLSDSRDAAEKYRIKEVFADAGRIVSEAARRKRKTRRGELNYVYRECAV